MKQIIQYQKSGEMYVKELEDNTHIKNYFYKLGKSIFFRQHSDDNFVCDVRNSNDR
jgi:hypothetical protein